MAMSSLATQLAEAASGGIKVISAEMAPDGAPSDDSDDEFIALVEVKFEIKGATVASLFGKQRRVLQGFLKKLSDRQALFPMGDRNKVSREVLQAVKPAIRKAVVRMADDDFRRGARVTNIDWSDTTEFNEVKVNAGAETLTYTIAFDVMGRWA
jgi:hypothetical protein